MLKAKSNKKHKGMNEEKKYIYKAFTDLNRDI